MKLTATSKIQNNQWRFNEDTGFLRCTAIILREGVLDYRRDELPGIPDDISGDTIRVYVTNECLEDAEAIESLEGAPATVGHIWQNTTTIINSCGNIAGTPVVEMGVKSADLLVTEKDTVRRVMLPPGNPEVLQEISSAYDAVIVWGAGVTPSGAEYDGVFTNLRYNHVAILPPNNGRAGATVRIINERGDKMDFTKVRLRNGKSIRVANEDVDALEDDISKTTEEVKNKDVSAEELQGAIDELAALKGERDAKDARIAELEGIVQSYKDQLEAALSDASVEAKADEIAKDETEAAAVMNSIGLTLDKTKKLRGTALKLHVVNSVRVHNGKPELTADETKSADYVNGLYKGIVSFTKVEPTGHQVVVNNSNNQQYADPRKDQVNRLYGKKEGA